MSYPLSYGELGTGIELGDYKNAVQKGYNCLNDLFGRPRAHYRANINVILMTE